MWWCWFTRTSLSSHEDEKGTSQIPRNQVHEGPCTLSTNTKSVEKDSGLSRPRALFVFSTISALAQHTSECNSEMKEMSVRVQV